MGLKIGSKVSFAYHSAILVGEVVAFGTSVDTVTIDCNSAYYVIPRENVLGKVDLSSAIKEEALDPIETEPEKTPAELEREKLRSFFFGQSPDLTGLGKAWKAQGRCPKCGEEGRIHLSTFVCSKHGTY